MKRTITIIAILVVAAIVAVCGIKYAADRTERNMQTLFDMPVPNVTVEETTTEVEETTTEVKIKPEEKVERYEDSALYRQVGVLSSKLPFSFGYQDAVGRVCMYVPTEERGDSDVWDNSYLVIEHRMDSEVIIKLDKADGIEIGNIVPMEEMEISNLTFVYLDGKYSQDYTMDRDGDMIILKDFPEGVEEIHIKNRSSNPIYKGVISGEKVYVNDIIIKVVD